MPSSLVVAVAAGMPALSSGVGQLGDADDVGVGTAIVEEVAHRVAEVAAMVEAAVFALEFAES